METTASTVELIDDELVGNVARAALFAALMGAFAYVSFPYPLSPAPVTLQVLGVFLAGLLLGPTWGTFAMVLYLLAGALGAPVFSGGSAGIGVLLGERIGYFLSFPIAAGAVGLIAHGRQVRDLAERSTSRLVGAMLVGMLLIYVLGVIGLAARTGMSPTQAVLVGAIVFVPADILKIAAAVGIVRSDRLAAV